VRFAYADPPYLGCGALYAKHHPEALVWDDPETHRKLIDRLANEWPDGWAMSLTSTSLRVILPMCPENCRVLAWCKPFVAFKDKTLAYAWEPVIFRGGLPVHIVDISGNPLSPWLLYHATAIHPTLAAACRAIMASNV
jgi:hypothetical protein